MGKIRKLIQIVSTIILNLNIRGLFDSSLYKGRIKGICVPGLNCNSCPLAVGTCPLGSLQSMIGNIKRGINLYVVGMITAFSVLFGRIVCGFLCPFGLFQELVYMIPSPKIIKRFKVLSYGKYVILAIFVIFIPVAAMIKKGMGFPAFCKYICPQGTIAGLLLSINNENIRTMIGNTFYLKIAVLIIIFLLSAFIFRPFCRFICPLGAIYGLFNSVSFVQIEVNKNMCTGCDRCNKACPLKLDVRKECNSTDCIRCGKCVDACNNSVLRYQVGSTTKRSGNNLKDQ